MLYAVAVLGFSIMGNHWHVLTEVSPASTLSGDDVRRRFMLLYATGAEFSEGQLEHYRERFCSLSWYVKDIKQGPLKNEVRQNFQKGPESSDLK